MMLDDNDINKRFRLTFNFLFGSVVVIAFKNNFRAEMHQMVLDDNDNNKRFRLTFNFLFGSMVVIAFKNNFRAKMYQNDVK